MSKQQQHHGPENIDDTDGLDNGSCPAHSGVCAVTRKNAEDIEKIWNRIDRINNYVVVAAGAVILQLGITVFDLLTHGK